MIYQNHLALRYIMDNVINYPAKDINRQIMSNKHSYERYEIPDSKGRKHAGVLFSENKSVVRNGIPSTAMGFVVIDLDANTYKD